MENYKILIIEDDLILTLSLELMLKKLNHNQITKVISGEKAIEAVELDPPNLMLVDIHLGKGITGIEAVKTIQKKYDIPALYITGNSDAYNKKLTDNTDYVDYLVKPITFKELQNALNKYSVKTDG
ncbi:MAG: response regulator [Balneolaceae bacterium]